MKLLKLIKGFSWITLLICRTILLYQVWLFVFFFYNFYDSNIPDINKASIYKDIKEVYFGGITEVYKPCGYNLYYYDVNYLYPFVALSDI